MPGMYRNIGYTADDAARDQAARNAQLMSTGVSQRILDTAVPLETKAPQPYDMVSERVPHVPSEQTVQYVRDHNMYQPPSAATKNPVIHSQGSYGVPGQQAVQHLVNAGDAAFNQGGIRPNYSGGVPSNAIPVYRTPITNDVAPNTEDAVPGYDRTPAEVRGSLSNLGLRRDYLSTVGEIEKDVNTATRPEYSSAFARAGARMTDTMDAYSARVEAARELDAARRGALVNNVGTTIQKNVITPAETAISEFDAGRSGGDEVQYKTQAAKQQEEARKKAAEENKAQQDAHAAKPPAPTASQVFGRPISQDMSLNDGEAVISSGGMTNAYRQVDGHLIKYDAKGNRVADLGSYKPPTVSDRARNAGYDTDLEYNQARLDKYNEEKNVRDMQQQAYNTLYNPRSNPQQRQLAVQMLGMGMERDANKYKADQEAAAHGATARAAGMGHQRNMYKDAKDFETGEVDRVSKAIAKFRDVYNFGKKEGDFQQKPVLELLKSGKTGEATGLTKQGLRGLAAELSGNDPKVTSWLATVLDPLEDMDPETGELLAPNGERVSLGKIEDEIKKATTRTY